MRALFGYAFAIGALSLLAAAAACSDEAGAKPDAGAGADAGEEAGESFNTGESLKVPVPATGRAYVKLASPPAIVTPADPKTDKGWDLAFEGLDVYSNSGPSGSGGALVFGPLDQVVFLGDTSPEVPFLSPDKAGGAFNRWYFYEGAPNHALHSRYHMFGVKDGTKLWKVQVISYYGTRDGAPVSALYKIRYAEVLPSGSGPIQVVENLDGTAGGAAAPPTSPSECIDLGTGERTKLTPDAARTSSAWHLCFRRQDISVNGEIGGPRNVGAVDFDADKTANEKLTDIIEKTPESEQGRFDAINAQSFVGQDLRGDRIISGFTGLWTERGANPARPGRFAWLVVGADGKSRYLVGFAGFTGATDKSPGTIDMRVKSVK
jgi:hypothetical protein